MCDISHTVMLRHVRPLLRHVRSYLRHSPNPRFYRRKTTIPERCTNASIAPVYDMESRIKKQQPDMSMPIARRPAPCGQSKLRLYFAAMACVFLRAQAHVGPKGTRLGWV